jgi:hypothetical protein
MPVVLVGIIFHTGSFDVPLHKQGVANLIAENLISRDTYLKLKELGIFCEVKIHEKYTEIVAKMNPRHVKTFFQIIRNNRFVLENLEILKKQIIINQKLAHNCFGDAISNEISAHIQYKNSNINNVFNEKIFSSISAKDAEEYFDQYYQRCHQSIIVSGAIGHKNLIKAVESTLGGQPSRLPVSSDSCINQIMKEIDIESKYVERSLRYFYKVPREDLILADSYFYIFNRQLFGFLEKAYPIIRNHECFYTVSSGDCIREIVLYPKSDVSLTDLQKMYEIFVDRICRQEISEETLSKIQFLRSYSKQFLSADLYAIYSKIKNDYLNQVEAEVEINNSRQFNQLSEKLLKNNPVLKITTRYRVDK